jgi:hypothetical protein
MEPRWRLEIDTWRIPVHHDWRATVQIHTLLLKESGNKPNMHPPWRSQNEGYQSIATMSTGTPRLPRYHITLKRFEHEGQQSTQMTSTGKGMQIDAVTNNPRSPSVRNSCLTLN